VKLVAGRARFSSRSTTIRASGIILLFASVHQAARESKCLNPWLLETLPRAGTAVAVGPAFSTTDVLRFDKEMTMKLTSVKVAAVALSLAFAGPLLAADSKPKDQTKAERERIEQEAKAAKDKCNSLKGNAKDICMAEARGKEKVAKAELAARQKDTPKNRYDVAAAKADMEYNIAKEKCDEMKGNEKDACQKDAKSARDNAKNQAKTERESAEGKKSRKS
jgi:hypothetical protein